MIISSKEQLMDLIRESPFARHLAESLLAKSAREQGFEQGFAQGFEQGFAQGFAQGRRHCIQEVLALRFDPGAAQSFAAGLEAIGDVQRLKQLHRAAIQVSSLEAFRHLVEADE